MLKFTFCLVVVFILPEGSEQVKNTTLKTCPLGSCYYSTTLLSSFLKIDLVA